MAYNVYFACDKCGDIGISLINENLTYNQAEKLAKKMGWIITDHGWICKVCQKELSSNKESNH